jgi:nitroreductase
VTPQATPGGVDDDGGAGDAATVPFGADVVRLITGRRSTREGFSSAPVPIEIIRQLLECGLAAPSSKHAQPWRFHVVTDTAVISMLADEVLGSEGIDTYVPHDPQTGLPIPLWPSTVRESAEVVRGVGTVIVVENTAVFGGGRRVLAAAPAENVRSFLVGYGLEMLGLGAAIENILIGAAALGVQAAFMGDVLIAEPAFRAALGLEGDLVGVIVLGYSDATPPPRSHDVDDPARVRWIPEGGRHRR